MRIQPPLSHAPLYPVTTIIGVPAIIVSVLWWSGQDINHLTSSTGSIVSRPWTLVTSIFPHIDLIHLAFNLLWWWVFGTAVERTWGSLRTIGLVLLLAVASSAAEYALGAGGVGLSGVVYGLCPMLYIAQRKYESLKGLVTQNVILLFAVWFVICIVLTVTDIMPVGNVAHAAGAIAGALVGMCIVAEPRRRSLWIGGLASFVVVTSAAATVFRPALSFFRSSTQNAYDGHLALVDGRYAEAIRLLEPAAAKQPLDAGLLVNLGIAYQRVDRHHEALELYRRAVAIDPALRGELALSIATILDHEAAAAMERRDIEAASSLAYEALRWNPRDDYAAQVLESIRQSKLAAEQGRGTEVGPIDAKPNGP